MNCHNVESILASGASELTAEVLSHLETCPACARLRSGEEDFQKLLDLAATVQVEPPQWLWHQIDTRIRHNRPESAWPESAWPESAWPESAWPESAWPEFVRGVRKTP